MDYYPSMILKIRKEWNSFYSDFVEKFCLYNEAISNSGHWEKKFEEKKCGGHRMAFWSTASSAVKEKNQMLNSLTQP